MPTLLTWMLSLVLVWQHYPFQYVAENLRNDSSRLGSDWLDENIPTTNPMGRRCAKIAEEIG